jgi:hypothetical protein
MEAVFWIGEGMSGEGEPMRAAEVGTHPRMARLR